MWILRTAAAWRKSLQAHIEKAMIFQALGDYDQALNALEKALSLGKSEGYIRSFVDQGIPMEDLLRKAIAARIKGDYANQLLMALRTDRVNNGLQADQKSSLNVEDLTDRETEVLRLLSTSLTIPEIADELVHHNRNLANSYKTNLQQAECSQPF